MKKLQNSRYTRTFLAWIALSAFILLGFIVLIAFETLTREYPKWHWWMSTVPVNVFSDAFVPVVGIAMFLFSIPIGFITLLPVLSYLLRWNKVRRTIEIICYIFSISLIWFGFWLIGWFAECKMLTLQSNGGPWGPCGYWAWFSRSLNTFVWHTIIWVIWSTALIGIWSIVKRKLLSNNESTLSNL